MTGIKPICYLEDSHPDKDNNKLIMLDPNAHKTKDDFNDTTREFLTKIGVNLNSFRLHEIELTYSNWGHTDILKAVLPEESDGVAGFSTVGHIVHLNLREEILDYKLIVGKLTYKQKPPNLVPKILATKFGFVPDW